MAKLTTRQREVLELMVGGKLLEGKGAFGFYRLLADPPVRVPFGVGHSLLSAGYVEVIGTRKSYRQDKPDTYIYRDSDAGRAALAGEDET